MNFQRKKVLICAANYSWHGKRPWNEPTLSVPILTAILKQHVDLGYLDANGEQLTEEEVKERITAFNPDMILIPALSVEYWKGYHALARITKEINPNCVVIIGGVYPTVLPEEVIKDDNVDIAMMGHAEERLDKLVNLIFEKENSRLKDFPGIAYMNDGRAVINPVKTYIGDLKEMVKPDYSLVNLEYYIGNKKNKPANFIASSNKRFAMVITSYGCPNNCIFCATRTISGRKTGFRKAVDVLEEIDYLV